MTPFPWHYARIAVYILLGLVGLHLLRSNWSSVSPALETWWASGTAQVQTNHTILRRDAQQAAQSTRLRAIAQRLQDSVGVWHTRSDSLTHALRAIADSLPHSSAGYRLVQRCLGELAFTQQIGAACQARGDSLERADVIDRLRVDSLKRALFAADTTLQRGLKVSQCHILIVSCPSRIASLEWGLGLGVVLGVIVAHH